MKLLRLTMLFLLVIIVTSLTGRNHARQILKPKTITVIPVTNCQQIDDSNITIIPSSCTGNDGSILGIKAVGGTGTYYFF